MKILIKSIKIIRKNPKLVFMTFILFILSAIFTLNINNFTKRMFFRKISENELDKNGNNVSYSIQYPLIYYFVQNISKHYYFGDWDYLNIKNNIFQNKKGEVELKFGRDSKGNFISGLETDNSTITLFFFLKDGQYIDYFFRGNISFSFPKGFSTTLNESITKKKFHNRIKKCKYIILFRRIF